MHISDGVLAPSVLVAGYAAGGALACVGLWHIRDRDYPLVGVMTAAFFVAGLLRVPVPPTSVHLTLNSLLGVVLGVRCFPAMLVALLLQALLLHQGGVTTLGVNLVMMAVPGYLAGQCVRWGLRRGWSGRWPFAAVVLVIGAVMPRMLADALVEVGWLRVTLGWPAAIGVGAAAAGALMVLEALLRAGPVFRWGMAGGALAVLLSGATLFAVLAFAPLGRLGERETFAQIARFAFLAHTPIMFVEGLMVALVLRYLLRAQPSLLAWAEESVTAARDPQLAATG